MKPRAGARWVKRKKTADKAKKRDESRGEERDESLLSVPQKHVI